jgi:hypothetical protein
VRNESWRECLFIWSVISSQLSSTLSWFQILIRVNESWRECLFIWSVISSQLSSTLSWFQILIRVNEGLHYSTLPRAVYGIDRNVNKLNWKWLAIYCMNIQSKKYFFAGYISRMFSSGCCLIKSCGCLWAMLIIRGEF